MLLNCMVALAILTAVVIFTLSALRYRAMVDGDQLLTQHAQFVADSVDRTLQQRMIEFFTFAALPPLRGLAASNPINRQDRLPVKRAELQSIVAADPNVRAASIIDLSGKLIVATDSTMNENWGDRIFVREAFGSSDVPEFLLFEKSSRCISRLSFRLAGHRSKT